MQHNTWLQQISLFRSARCGIWKASSSSARGLTVFSSVVCLLLGLSQTFGHGSVGDPISRVYRIFLENPQSPDRPVSTAAIAVGGTQPFYDWSEVNRLAPNYASGDLAAYRLLIPDGQLASVGREKYAGLDLVRDDWPATPVNAGPYPVVFDAHVPHDPSYFKAFISRPGWGPDQPLGWDDLELLEGPEDFVRDGALYRFSVAFPPEPAITCCLWFGNGSIRQGKFFSL